MSRHRMVKDLPKLLPIYGLAALFTEIYVGRWLFALVGSNGQSRLQIRAYYLCHGQLRNTPDGVKIMPIYLPGS
jgi:hypothetical protein